MPNGIDDEYEDDEHDYETEAELEEDDPDLQPPADAKAAAEKVETRVVQTERDDAGELVSAETIEHYEQTDGGPKVHLTRWVCSGPGCGATWKQKPSGEFHSHEVPVPGSKSRVTYENHAITAVRG